MFFTIHLKYIISLLLTPLIYYLFIRFILCLPPKGLQHCTKNRYIININVFFKTINSEAENQKSHKAQDKGHGFGELRNQVTDTVGGVVTKRPGPPLQAPPAKILTPPWIPNKRAQMFQFCEEIPQGSQENI